MGRTKISKQPIVTGKQQKKQKRDIKELETYWAINQSKKYTSLDECPF